MEKNLPKEIFVHWEGSRDGKYLVADANAGESLESGQKRVEGRYVLEQIVAVSSSISVEPVRKKA